MDDALFVGRFHTLSDLAADFQGLLHWHWPFGNTLSQGFAFHHLQGKKAHSIRFFQAIDGSNVGVIQRGQEFRLPLKPCVLQTYNNALARKTTRFANQESKRESPEIPTTCNRLGTKLNVGGTSDAESENNRALRLRCLPHSCAQEQEFTKARIGAGGETRTPTGIKPTAP